MLFHMMLKTLRPKDTIIRKFKIMKHQIVDNFRSFDFVKDKDLQNYTFYDKKLKILLVQSFLSQS